MRLTESDSGIDLSTGTICPDCGARNDSLQPRCWQCRAALAPESAARMTPRPRPSSHRRIVHTRAWERWLALLALAGTISALLLTGWLLREAVRMAGTPAHTLEQVYNQYLTGTRAVMGAFLIAAWPGILHASSRILRLKFSRPGYFLTFIGIILGSLAYGLTFLPWPAAPVAALLIPAGVALCLFAFVLQLPAKALLPFWAFQGAFVMVVAAAVLWGLESIVLRQPLNPLVEIPAIYKLARFPGPPQQHILPNHRDDTFPPLIWVSTGSTWLDQRANRVQITLEAPEGEEEWELTVKESGAAEPAAVARYSDFPGASPLFIPRTDVNYWLQVVPESARGGTAFIRSVVPVRTGGRG